MSTTRDPGYHEQHAERANDDAAAAVHAQLAIASALDRLADIIQAQKGR